MKKSDCLIPAVAVAVSGIILAALTISGWDHYDFGWSQGGEWHNSLKVQRKKAEFIRSHPCTVIDYIEPSEALDADFNVKRKSGYKAYSCTGFRDWLFIDDDEVQP